MVELQLAFFYIFKNLNLNTFIHVMKTKKSTYLKEITQKRALVYRMIGLGLSDLGHSASLVPEHRPW